jgi:hypothetical protein
LTIDDRPLTIDDLTIDDRPLTIGDLCIDVGQTCQQWSMVGGPWSDFNSMVGGQWSAFTQWSISYIIVRGEKSFQHKFFWHFIQVKSCGSLFSPFVWDRINVLSVYFTEDGLLFGRQEDTGGVIFGQISCKHSLADHIKANSFEMWFCAVPGKERANFVNSSAVIIC